MPQLTLTLSYSKNTGLVINAAELANLYFTGIPLQDQYGNPIPEETINFFIEAAQKEIADYLNIKLQPTYYWENRDWSIDQWLHWGFISTNYPVNKPLGLEGFLNNNLQVSYPVSWLSSKKQSGDPDLYHRNISVVPGTGASAVFSSYPFFINAPWMTVYGGEIPNYWKLTVRTGFERIPADILKAIGYLASIDVFRNLSDIISGTPGISGKSIGLDGLNQNMTTTASSGRLAFSGRIDSYRNELKDSLLPNLKMRYVGIRIASL